MLLKRTSYTSTVNQPFKIQHSVWLIITTYAEQCKLLQVHYCFECVTKGSMTVQHLRMKGTGRATKSVVFFVFLLLFWGGGGGGGGGAEHF